MKKYLFPFVALVLVGCSAEQRVGVVDLPSLYASFEYQKELDAEYAHFEEHITREKDSLTRAIQAVEMSLAASPEYTDTDKNILFERAYNGYVADQEYLSYLTDSVANAYSTKVWKQLNSYMQQYGEENSYDVIIGMQGDGNVMYVKEGVNITNDVIAYANQKYNGE